MNETKKDNGKGLVALLLEGLPVWAKFILALLVIVPAWYGGSGQFFGFGAPSDKADEAKEKAHKGYKIFREKQEHTEKELDALGRDVAQLRMFIMYIVMSKHGEVNTHEMLETLDRYNPGVPKPKTSRSKPFKPTSLPFEEGSLDDLLGIGVGSGIGSGGGGGTSSLGSGGGHVEIGDIKEVGEEAKEEKKVELPKPDSLDLPPMKSQELVEQRPAMPAAL